MTVFPVIKDFRDKLYHYRGEIVHCGGKRGSAKTHGRPLIDACAQSGAGAHWAGAWWEQPPWYLTACYVRMDSSVTMTLQWAQGCRLKIDSIEVKYFTVSFKAHLSGRLTENTSLEEGEELMRELVVKGKLRTGCRSCVAVVGDWLQMILIIFSPLGRVRFYVNSTEGNVRLFPPSYFHHSQSLTCVFSLLALPFPFLSLSFPLTSAPLPPASVRVDGHCLSDCVYTCHTDLGSVWLTLTRSDSVAKSNQASTIMAASWSQFGSASNDRFLLAPGASQTKML